MTVAVKNKPPVVVPAAALRRAGFKRGQELEVKSASGVITIVPKTAGEYTAQERRALNRGIHQSLKEQREGKGAGPFVTAEEFIADLHRESAKLDAKKNRRARR
jgi:bifunctional DNA-binding transcriptional regulator/antitoxin component of YhaV-PrlF toxin-antitoxin module